MSNEEFFPTRWILRCVDRQTFAEHVKKLKQKYGNIIAKKCIYHAHYIGCLR